MFSIAAAVIGTILAALITFGATRYRSLITYEKTEAPLLVKVEQGKVVPASDDDGYFDTARITAYHIKITNRGWKSVSNAKFHVPRMADAFSIAKGTLTVSPESIAITPRGSSLEIDVEFFPRKEEIEVVLANFSISSISVIGAGPTYECKSIAYYKGYMTGASFLLNVINYCFMFAAGAVIGALFLATNP